MQFTAISFWLFTGLAVLTAAVLAALQYLRIRPRQVRVVTTLFWQQSADQARARTLFERFRNPRTYLLLLAASLLVLLALARPVFTSAGKAHRVIILEAGLEMAAADNRFDNALELVRAEAASSGDDHVAVITADPRPRLLKHFDESIATLESRLGSVKAADEPVLREDSLRAAKAILAGRENGEVVLVAAQPVKTGDDSVRILAAGGVMENAFILSAVFVPDSSHMTRGELHCRIGFTGEKVGNLEFRAMRSNIELMRQSVELKPGEMRELVVPGLAADGNVLTVSVTGDNTLAGDDRVEFQLPDRRRIRVATIEGIEMPPVLASVLESLTECSVGSADGGASSVVRIGAAGSDAEIQIQPAGAGGEWMAVKSSAHPLMEGMFFEDALCRAPATPLDSGKDGLTLLWAGGAAIATQNPDARRLTVSSTLFDPDASLVRRTAYLVFWSRMMHHLAGWSDEPLTLSPVRSSRSVADASAVRVMKASMVNFDLLSGAKAAAPGDVEAAKWPVWQILLTAALALMTLEAFLNIRGRIS